MLKNQFSEGQFDFDKLGPEEEFTLHELDKYDTRQPREPFMAVVGCGTLATAIVSGIIGGRADKSILENHPVEDRVPNGFILNVRSKDSCKRLKEHFKWHLGYNPYPVSIIQNETAAVIDYCDYVLLGCKPYMVKDILSQPGVKDALKGKMLISICAGVTVEDLHASVYGPDAERKEDDCKFVHVMPNTAAKICESTTVITPSNPPLSSKDAKIVHYLFAHIGKVVHLPANLMDASTALAGSGPAFFLLMLDAAIDGAVAMGIPRKEATLMAAQTMKGAAINVLGSEGHEGMHPAVLKDQVTTPGGCTMAGLMVMEEEGVRGSIAKCIRRATVVASKLGGGEKNVNGI